MVSGPGTASIDLNLPAFDLPSHFDQMSQPVGSSGGAYVGWYLQRLPGGEPVTGTLRLAGLVPDAGELSRLPLGPPVDHVAAGRYRLWLLSDGPGQAIIPSASLTSPISVQATTPRRIEVSPVMPLKRGVVDVQRIKAFGAPVEATSLALSTIAENYRSARVGVTQVRQCAKTPPGGLHAVRPCPKTSAHHRQVMTPTPGVWGASVWTRFYLPGELTPGPIEFVFDATAATVGYRASVAAVVLYDAAPPSA